MMHHLLIFNQGRYLFFLKLFQRFFEVHGEYGDGEENGQTVRGGLGGVYCADLVGQKLRHDVDKRQKQYEFAHDRDDYRAQRIAYRDEGHLACYLDAENEHRAAVDAQCVRGKVDKLCIRGEHAREYLWKQHDQRPKRDGIDKADIQQQAEAFAHTRGVFRTEVIARYRLCTLRNALKRQHRKLHDAHQYRHCANRYISAVAQQRCVEAH